MRRHLLLVALVGALSLMAVACSDADAEAGSTTTARPTTAAPSTTLAPPDLSALGPELEQLVATQGLSGAGLVVVDRDAGVVGEFYTGDIGPDRVSLIASASKMLTAGVLLRLADQGKLDLDAPVADAVPWGAAHPEVTVAQLLSNSSGLPGLLARPLPPEFGCQYAAVGTLQECGERIFTAADTSGVVPPDTEFRYGGAQWQVAGAVAEAVSGTSWAELVEETYVEPCGTDSLAYNNHFTQIVNPAGPFNYPAQFDGDPGVLRPTDNPNMEGGAYADPRDYAELVLMQLRDGRCGDTRVLSEESVRRMQSDRIAEAFGGSTGTPLEGYGMGWWIDRDPPGRIEDAGAYGATPWIDRGRGYGAYLVVESRTADGAAIAAGLRPLIEQAYDGRG